MQAAVGQSRHQDTINMHIGASYRMTTIVGAIACIALAFQTQHQQVESKPTPTSIEDQQQHDWANFPPAGDGSRFSGQQDNPIRAIHYHFDQKMEPHMQLVRLNETDENSNTVTCNDGSPIGYYKRLNGHSKSWIIYLQGGGFCGSEEACQQRWRHFPWLMSSNNWPKLKSVDGILSSEPKDNPYLWNANHIYVPYCSSDSWTGQQEARADQAAPSFTFMGSRIIERVLDSLFDDLPRETSLYESKFVLLAGDSAGATGVILNLDKVNRLVLQRFNASNDQQLRSARQAPVLRGLADSGWFLDNEPYDFGFGLQADWMTATWNSQTQGEPQELDCDRQRCTPLQSSRQAMLYWNGQVPAACATRQTVEPWRCYFAHHAYQSLKTPLFVVQWLYDEAQLLVDNIVRPNTVDQWNYVNKLVNEMRRSLENVTALFAPSCFSHSLIIKQSWNQININGFRLPHVLNSWEEEVLSNQPTLEALLSLDPLEVASGAQLLALENNQQTAPHIQRAELTGVATSRFATDERPARFQKATNFELRTTTAKAIAGSNNNSHGNLMQTSQTVNQRPKGRKKRRNNSQQHSTSRVAIMTNRLSRSTGALLDDATPVFSNSVPDLLLTTTSRQQEGADKFRLIDTCGWPQCNRDCPSLDQELNMRPILPY